MYCMLSVQTTFADLYNVRYSLLINISAENCEAFRNKLFRIVDSFSFFVKFKSLLFYAARRDFRLICAFLLC